MTQVFKIFQCTSAREILLPYAGEKDINVIEQIAPEDTILPKDEKTLVLNTADYLAVLEQLREKLVPDKDYVIENIESSKSPEDNYDECINVALKNVRGILDRIYHRRTGMFSWILLKLLQRGGFEGDSFKNVKDELSDPDFIKKFGTYYSTYKNKGKDAATEYLLDAFKDDKKKQTLAKIALFSLNFSDELPKPILNILPIVFGAQNLFVPALKRFIFKEGFISKALGFMRIINPWLSEFFVELIALFKGEIGNLKTLLPSTVHLSKVTANDEKISLEKRDSEISSINLSNVTEEDYRLEKIVDKVDAVFERHFGKKNNISSWVVYGVLKRLGFDNYPDFKKKVSSDEFIKALREHFKELKNHGAIKPINDRNMFRASLKKHFGDIPYALIPGAIVSSVVLVANSLGEDFIKETTKKFGKIYSFQYLFMPIITEIVGEKNIFGKLLGIIRDINPLINDFIFDPLATFRGEILDLRKDSESIKEKLIPEIELPSSFDSAINYLQTFIGNIRRFIQSVKETGTEAAPG